MGDKAYTLSSSNLRRAFGIVVALVVCAACARPGPDLTAQILAPPSPAVLLPGDPFALPNRACNTGAFPADATGVTFLWREAGMPETQTPIGWRPLPPLAPGACHDDQTLLDAPFGYPDGAYEIIVMADYEKLIVEPYEGNNFALSAVIGFGYGPDLVVAGITAPPTAENGATVTVEAEVCNAGSAWSDESKIQALLSEDDEISIDPPTPDWWLGELDVPQLASGACATVVGEFTIAAPDGAYTIGGIADGADSVLELIESNNATAAGAIAVGFGPDLIVSQILGPFSAPNGSSFSIDLEVCNQGTAPSDLAMVSLHLSLDAEITPAFPDPASGDPEIGMASLPGLDRGQCHAASIDASAWVPTEGAWRLGAYVDFSNEIAELFETNNATAGALVGVGAGPDYVVSELAAPPSTADNFEVQVQVCNRGTEPGGSAALTLYLSADEVLDPGPPGIDPEVGYHTVSGLPQGECESVVVDAFPNAPGDGPYWLVARIDTFEEVSELIETNNDLWGDLMGIGLGPDLIVTFVGGPPSALNYANFTATATVCNQGTLPSGPSSVVFYHSSDPNVVGFGSGPTGPGDFYAGELSAPDLAPGACASIVGDLYASVENEGAYYFGAIVDDPPGIAELIETNNTTVGPQMGVGYGPDLRIESITAPPSAFSGAQVQLAYEVCNDGTAMSAPASLTLYLSADAQIEPPSGGPIGPDEMLADVALPMLLEGACHADSYMVGLPPPASGPHFVGGVVDESNVVPELLETNNDHAEDVIGIGSGPDFVVASVTGPASSFPSGPLPITVEVCNEGTQLGSTAVSLYLSADGELESSYLIPSGDPLLGVFSMPTLAPGECKTEVFDTSPFVPDGVWHLGAIADDGAYETELREDNNARVGGLVGIGSGPDLFLLSIDAPPNVTVGIAFNASVEVCNQGNTQAPTASLSFYHSEDDFLTGQIAAPTGPDALLGFGSTSTPLPPAACDTHVMELTTFVDPGSWRIGVIVDEDEGVAELIEQNNQIIATPHDVSP